MTYVMLKLNKEHIVKVIQVSIHLKKKINLRLLLNPEN